MDSSQLYHTRQQFFLGAYSSLVAAPLPSPASSDYTPALLYAARAHLALDAPANALGLLEAHPDQEHLSIKAATALSKFVESADDSALEELRDLTIEAEAGDDEHLKSIVKVLAGTALVRAGELEEAIDTLGPGSQDLEVILILTQIYLSISRPDLAIKLFVAANKHSEDDLLLSLIESSISLYSPPASLSKSTNLSYRNAESYFTEQIANPSLSSPHMLKSRGVTRILMGEFEAAKSDLEESLSQRQNDPEAKGAYVVATALAGGNVDELWSELEANHPNHPMVTDVAQKSALFDQMKAKWSVPKTVDTIAA